jgi:single-strand DNA-binding protein
VSEGLNQVNLLGNLGADPEFRSTPSGGVLQLRMATTETYLDRNRTRQETTEWHTVVVWGRRGEALSRILSKGSKIMVTGSLRTTSWEPTDGSGKRYRTQIVARNVLLCGDGRGGQRSDFGQPPAQQDDGGYYPPGGDQDDDIPF